METILHSFTGCASNANCGTHPPDGASPAAGLVRGSDGNFYGTTTYGGDYSVAGTVFRISASGAEAVLYSFSGCDNPAPCGI